MAQNSSSIPESSSPGRDRALALAVFAVAVAICLPDLGRHLYWPNEADVVASGMGTLGDVFHLRWANQSWGWPLLMHFWMAIGGRSEFWTRLASVLSGALGAVWLLRLGTELASRRVGVLSAALFLATPAVHWHTREARMYGLLAALTVGGFLYALRWERRRRRRDLVALVAVLVAAVYLHFVALAIAASLLGVVLVSAALAPRSERPALLRDAAAAALSVALLSIPQVLRLGAGVDYSGGRTRRGLTGGLIDGLQRLGREFYDTRRTGPPTDPNLLAGLLILALGLLALGLLRPPRTRVGAPPSRWFRLALFGFVVCALGGTIAAAGQHDIRPRYATYVLGPLALGAALAAGSSWWPLRIAAWVGIVVLLRPAPAAIRNQHHYVRGNLDRVMAYLAQERGPEDTIVAEPPLDRSIVQLKIGSLPLSRRQAAALAPDGLGDTVWLVSVKGRRGRPNQEFLRRDYRLLEVRADTAGVLYRWVRSQRDADRARELALLRARAQDARGEGAATVLLTGSWDQAGTADEPLTRELSASADLLVPRSVGVDGGPQVSLRSRGMRRVAKGSGWTLRAGEPRVLGRLKGSGRVLRLASLDLRRSPGQEPPAAALEAVTALGRDGTLILRLIPRKRPARRGKGRKRRGGGGLGAARRLVEAGAAVVTVDGLRRDALGPHRGGLILPGLGTFSSSDRPYAPGALALLTVPPQGPLSVALVTSTADARGRPRLDGMGIDTAPAPRPAGRKAFRDTAAYDERRAGSGASLLDRFPGEASASIVAGRGVARRCLPLPGASQLYWEEAGPDRTGQLWDRLMCSADPFQDQWDVVAQAEHRIGGEPHRCLWLHPQKFGPATLRFDSVDLGAVLQGHVGISDHAMNRRRLPMNFSVLVDGEPVHSQTLGMSKGWLPWAADTAAFQEGTHTLEFEVSARSNRWRHLCFDAELLP